MTIILEPITKYWACPDCDVVDRTQRSEVESRMHNCGAYGFMTVPLVQVNRADDKPDARHTLLEREDYVGNEVGVGRYMSIRTERADGSYDQAVYAPVAAISVSGV